VLHQEPISDQRGGQAGLIEPAPVLLAGWLDLPVQDAVAAEDLAARIAE
jgi:hypothetical protein